MSRTIELSERYVVLNREIYHENRYDIIRIQDRYPTTYTKIARLTTRPEISGNSV